MRFPILYCHMSQHEGVDKKRGEITNNTVLTLWEDAQGNLACQSNAESVNHNSAMLGFSVIYVPLTFSLVSPCCGRWSSGYYAMAGRSVSCGICSSNTRLRGWEEKRTRVFLLGYFPATGPTMKCITCLNSPSFVRSESVRRVAL